MAFAVDNLWVDYTDVIPRHRSLRGTLTIYRAPMGSAPQRRTVVAVAGPAELVAELRSLVDPAAYEVRSAEGADDGAAGPGVVVADLDRAGGLDAALRAVPVLAVVRRDAPEDSERAMKAGVLDVLAVPFEAPVVRARLAVVAQLSAARQDLGARNAELATWAQRAGHDLRSPLAVISGMAETLEAAWDRLPEPDRARMLASIRNQAARALALVDEGVALAGAAPASREDPERGPAVEGVS